MLVITNITSVAISLEILEAPSKNFFGGKEAMGTRARLLQSSAALFAAKGYHGVSIEELGANIGLTGPAIYRHFPTKSALLAEMLITASSELLAGANLVLAEKRSASETLIELIGHHTHFALENPELIRVQEQDFGSLDETQATQLRRLQRKYVEVWVAQILIARKGISTDAARTMAHAIFGMLNSTPRIKSDQKKEMLAKQIKELAERALLG